jgi:hypothetical protein
VIWILGAGPSLTPADCELLRGQKVIAVNTAYHLATWADYLYACDLRWWDWHYGDDPKKHEFKGERWTQDQQAKSKYHLHWMRSVRQHGLSKVPGVIHQGANGGYQACGLAYHWGHRQIRLLGFDMKPGPGGKKHFHGDHPAPMNASLPYPVWVDAFKGLAADCITEGVEIINCTRDTALTCFPRASIEETLARDRQST